MDVTLRKLTADEFVRRLKSRSERPDARFAFFLGAGCSVSSGIPSAASLVRDRWLPRLRDVCAPHRTDVTQWAVDRFPTFDQANPAVSYGAVMEDLFHYVTERQQETEDLCDGQFPGFGYAVLANLMATQGGVFNVALTTNFDDLIADALYLYTRVRPLVIHHEALGRYIRPTRTRPLVVKLHGDHRLSPMHTAAETSRLNEGIEDPVRTLLHDRGLIFLGYGGNDQSVCRMLKALPDEALHQGVYWVSSREPKGVLRPWLEESRSTWVENRDFDELMVLVRDTFGLAHPDRGRFDDVFEKYTSRYTTLSRTIRALPDTAPDAPALKGAVERTDETFPDWSSVEVAAQSLKDSDPARADAIYADGVEQFGTSASLLGNYAVFLTDVRGDHDRAEVHYRRALAADPDNTNNLGNYANFLTRVRGDHDRAEEHYRRALAADPRHADHLGNYAVFLTDVRGDHDRAEEHYRRALAADPSNATNLGNYAGILLARGRSDEGLAVLEQALEQLGPSNNPSLAAECWFYAFAHRRANERFEALRELKRVLQAGARSPGWNLKPNIERAKGDSHPAVPWLEKLAAVISDGADIETLGGWQDWAMA